MNAKTKAVIANIITALVAVIVPFQTVMLTDPPFTQAQIVLIGGICTILSVSLTSWKQYFSPDVTNVAAKAMMWTAIVVTLTVIAEQLSLFSVSNSVAKWVTWGISVVVMIINITSKQLFPSAAQEEKMANLKWEK